MKHGMLTILFTIMIAVAGIIWNGDVQAAEAEGTAENAGTEQELTGTLGDFSGIMGEKVLFAVENGAEGWRYDWRYAVGDSIDNDDYYRLGINSAEASVMINQQNAANTYWCHITDTAGNEMDTIPCRVVCELDANYVANGICGEQITWNLDADGVLTIEGNGALKLTDISWITYEDQITTVYFGEGITEIGMWTFSQEKSVTNVRLPDTLTVIGDYAFCESGLEEIVLPDGLEVIGEYAFAKTMKNMSGGVYLPDGLTTIGSRAFYECGMDFLSVPSSVTEIGDYAFEKVRIHCEAGSYAEMYAAANGVSYEIVEHAGKEEDVAPKMIDYCTITLETESYYYDGFAKEPAVTVLHGETQLQKDVDYTVTYMNNFNIGAGIVEIVGIGEYTGSEWKYFNITNRNNGEAVVIPSGTPKPEQITYIEGTDIPEKIVLYAMDEKWNETISIPEGFTKSFALNPAGGSVELRSGTCISVSETGVITPIQTTWYWNGNVGSTVSTGAEGETVTNTYEYGEAVIHVVSGGKEYDIPVEVVNYADYYAEYIMQKFVEESVLPIESDLGRLEKICQFVCAYDYSEKYSSYTGMILGGGGDCWASSYTIIYMCEQIGFPAHVRYAANDPGAGGGHRNVAVQIGNEIYVADAGMVGYAPRSYLVQKTEQGWYYSRIGEKEMKLIQYDGRDEHVVVPSVIQGNTVTTIGEGALYYGVGFSGAEIKSITISETITKIGDFAFARSGTLAEMKVDADNVCFASEDGVLFDKSKERLIAYPTGKAGFYTVPSMVKTIGVYAFTDMTALEAIRIPESVKTIEGYAFDDCAGLKRIYFDGNAPVIEDYAFNWVKANVYYPEGNVSWSDDVRTNYKGSLTWKTWQPGVFDGIENDTGSDGVQDLENGNGYGNDGANGTENDSGNGGSSDSTDAGNNSGNSGSGVTTDVGNDTENGEISDTGVHVGAKIKVGKLQYEITGEGQVSVTALISNTKKISIPKNVSYKGRTYQVTAVADKAFKNTVITQVSIGNNVKSIGKSAFEGCKKLTKVNIGTGVVKIGKNAFKNCRQLKSIVIKSVKLKTVGSSALKGIKTTANIKVPKKKLDAYKKLLKKKGIGKKMNIIRQ